MSGFFAPCAYALLVWWFATGIILWLDRRPKTTFRWSFSGMTLLALAAAVGVPWGAADVSTGGAYTAFSCAIVLWAWLEMSFLMGFITGSRRHACSAHCSGFKHFVHSAQAVIYNDLATALLVGGAYAATWHAPNRIAFWTLVILWGMRISAKLNLHLGVPNLGEKFLPEHLQYLRSFFRRRPMNVLFPLSVTLGTFATVRLLQAYLSSTDAFHATGLALMSSILMLGVLEHWFMVLPLPSERLWSWAFHEGVRLKRGRQTPRTMLAIDSVSSSHNPPHSVRSTAAN